MAQAPVEATRLPTESPDGGSRRRWSSAPRRPSRYRTLLAKALVVWVLVLLGVASTSPALVGLALATALLAPAVLLCASAPRTTVLVLLGWLAAIGTLRRLLLYGGVASQNDPLLLVAPIGVAVLVVVAAKRGAFRSRTPLSTTVLLFSGLCVIGAFNPAQGGPVAGLAGLLFFLVPVLWFWVGRGLLDDQLFKRVLLALAVLTPLAAIYGLWQVYTGFPPWDANWIRATPSYGALSVGKAFRPFASLSSTADYVGYVAIGLVLWTLLLRRRTKVLLVLLVVAVLGAGLAVGSVRGALVGLVVTLGVVFAVSRGYGIGRTAFFGLGSLWLLSLIVGSVNPNSFGTGNSSALLSRQVVGLADPFNRQTSTLPGHIDTMVGGLTQALREPLGRGPAAVTLAGQKLGSGATGTDIDPSNVAVALGLPGLLTYLVLVVLGLRRAFELAGDCRDYFSLAVLGILVITCTQWLAGGNYAVAPLPWLMLGWLDRPANLEVKSAPSTAVDAER